ncbi:MAG: glycoside hydrolase family 3 C-terminal domain-containing protein, partial [Actinomycetota bacterium]
CSGQSLRSRLTAAGFSGFIRTDSGAVQDPIAALTAGPTLFKPSQAGAMFAALDSGQLTHELLAIRATQVATVLFQHGLFDRTRTPVRAFGPTVEELSAGSDVSSQSMVLLKNSKVLPLSKKTSIAVIGTAAALSPSYGIGGSSFVAVHQPTTFTQALINQFGARNVTVEPATPKEPLTSFIPSGNQPGVVTTTSTFTVPTNGPYVAKLIANSGTTMARVSIDGKGRGAVLVQRSTGSQRTSWVQGLSAGPHLVTIRWASTGAPPTFTLQSVGKALLAASDAARAVSVPVVFVGVPSTESYDAGTLNLPDFQDLLISAVAAANPRTVVVIESPRPIAMPWLSQVAGVLDVFYVGQSGGTATARALTGDLNPSGHLPFTFPAAITTSPLNDPTIGANANGVQSLTGSDGIGMSFGMHALGATPPVFPFGFGLSYTTFIESALTATATSSGITASVTVTNVGTVPGRAVIQAYLTYPTGFGEPSRQLKAIGQASLQPGASVKIPLVIPNAQLTIWPNGQPIIATGRMTLETGWSSSSLPLSTVVNLENAASQHRVSGAVRG